MSFMDKIKTGLRRAAEDGWLVVRGGAKVAAGKSGDVARTGRLKYQVYGLHRKADKKMSEIGGMVYDIAVTKPGTNPLEGEGVTDIIGEIQKIEEEINEIEANIAELKKKEGVSEKKNLDP